MNVFNDKDFSDRILQVEIEPDSLDSESDSAESDGDFDSESDFAEFDDDFGSEVDSAESEDDFDMDFKINSSNKKQKIESLEETGDAANDNTSNKKQKTENLEEKGDDANDDNLKCCTDVKVKTLHICSGILATKSPFFYKLFKNGMRESQERVVTLKIFASEEAALMDLLNFMYSNTLSATSAAELVGVLIIADKFEVSSCMSYCCEQLKKLPMSLESAIIYLELPSSVLDCVLVKSLLDAAKKYVAKLFRNVTRADISQEDAASLPLSAIEIVLGSDSLRITSEEDVCDFILLWGRARYPRRKERRAILTKLLGRYIYFPCLSMSRLKEIQECPDFDGKEVSKLIVKSLYSNAGFYGPRCHSSAVTRRHSIKLDDNALPIHEVLFESRCIVYLNLTEEKCWDIVGSSKGVYSKPFPLGGAWLAFFVEPEAEGGDDYISLFVEMQQEADDGTCCMFDYELAVKKESSKEFECLHKADHCTITKGQRVGSKKLFEVPPPCFEFYDDGTGSEYVIDGVVHVRAEFIINSQA